MLKSFTNTHTFKIIPGTHLKSIFNKFLRLFTRSHEQSMSMKCVKIETSYGKNTSLNADI